MRQSIAAHFGGRRAGRTIGGSEDKRGQATDFHASKITEEWPHSTTELGLVGIMFRLSLSAGFPHDLHDALHNVYRTVTTGSLARNL